MPRTWQYSRWRRLALQGAMCLLLGCFLLGLFQDLVTQQPPGLFALSYGLTGMVAVSAHHAVYREHPLTHFLLVLLGGLVTSAVLLLHAWVHPAAPRSFGPDGTTLLPAIRLSAAVEFTRTVYTALLAPVVLGLLQRCSRFFAFQSHRRKARTW